MRLTPTEIETVLVSALQNNGFEQRRAELCARLFIETTLDGVYSHGLNRFPLFLSMVEKRLLMPASEPLLVSASGSFETWDGQLGPGNLNAWVSMDRAIELAGESGMGVVALRNTNHWMRGGSYGLQAARSGCIGICMTNTKPNMPPWGGSQAHIGNNPMIISVPHEPYPILLDMAMSQFSYGKMEVLQQQGDKLPFAGGFDKQFELTADPSAIIESELALPAGYWKGSGLAILIDLLVAILSGGQTTSQIGLAEEEYGVSQLFMAFDLSNLNAQGHADRVVREIISSLMNTAPMQADAEVCYPGQRSWRRRQENLEKGIPVDKATWDLILEAADSRG